MSSRPTPPHQLTGLFDPLPRDEVLSSLVRRAGERLDALPPDGQQAMMEDLLFHERKRLSKQGGEPEEFARLDALGEALLHTDVPGQRTALLDIAHAWADEIHGHFDPATYHFATTTFPPALQGLLSAGPRRVRDLFRRRPASAVTDRVTVEGEIDFLRELAAEATLILAPTHVSNLDSPLLGLSFVKAGLPPFQYGAGLNLFSNPVLGWWMSRLGAYTVDRTKASTLYKDVLKDYSVFQLQHRHHGLFFPGGTRARSGALETRLKKGLLGTGVAAWQEMLAAHRPHPNVYVVPVTLSFQLVLEANTLIQDHLAEAGKQRYIISDDEFAQPRRLAAFVGRVLSLDASCVVRFGAPLDVLGRPVPRDAADRHEASLRRRSFVCDRNGEVQADAQRDRVYTENLADALVAAYPGLSTVMSTHLAAWAAWRALEQSLDTTDVFRILRAPLERRRIPRQRYLDVLASALHRVRTGAAQGRWHMRLPDTAEAVLDEALARLVGGYHRSDALRIDDGHLVVADPQLTLYYRNRALVAGEEVPCA